MSKIKDLLSERQIHRFMKLAEISSLGETEELEEATEVTEEAEELEESTEVTEEAEELEEGGLADRDDPRNRRNTPRSRPMEEGEVSEGEEVVEETKGFAQQMADKHAAAAAGEKTDIVVNEAAPEAAAPISVRESQMHDLVGRINARIVQENQKVQGMTREASFEQQVRLVEAQMAQNIERNRAIHQREALTEALVGRVINRLKEIKK